MPASSTGRRPIGVFDSGAGGLAILETLRRRLPHRDFVYVADTARAPYGTKPREIVQAFAREMVGFLCGLGVDGIVIASHTASAVALPEVAEACAVPVWGVIEGAVEAAARTTRSGWVGVIGSQVTVDSGACQRRLERRGLRWWARSSPEGLADRPPIDTLILGCWQSVTEREAIGRAAGPEVQLVDGVEETAEAVARAFPAAPRCFRQGRVTHYVSGDPGAFLLGVEEVLRLPCPPEDGHGEAWGKRA